MSRRNGTIKRQIATDHELQRLRSLSGFAELERRLDADLQRLTRRYAEWHQPPQSGDRSHFCCEQRASS